MNEQLYSPKQLSDLLKVTPETLREWHKKGVIQATTTQGGHRRYIYNGQSDVSDNRKGFIYCRVSSSKQRGDLERQIAFMQKQFPTFEVVQDIGSGLNFKRKGLSWLLEQVMSGNVSKVVVAHRDRLCRFGYELIVQVLQHFNTTLEVFGHDSVKEPITELGEDLLSIITVFSARYHGARKYKVQQKDKNLPKRRTKRVAFKMPRHV